MARQKSNKKESTEYERLQKERNIGLRDIERIIQFINNPTYFFKVAEEVIYGAFKKCVIDDIFDNGKYYGLICDSVDNNYGNPIEYKTYRVAAWQEIRPINHGNTSFSENQDIKMYFNNSTIKSLLYYNYSFGIDFNPEYQRGYVWDQKDKELLIDSVFKNIDIGKFVLIHLSDKEWFNREFSYEILDGKQRLSTLIEFYENRFAYNGKFYNDLSAKDKRVFENHIVSFAEVQEMDKQMVLRYFLMLNRTGKSMDKKHLEKVEKMLDLKMENL